MGVADDAEAGSETVFHMHQEYGLPINPELGVRLLDWHRADPPRQTEKRRKEKIAEIRGTGIHSLMHLSICPKKI